MVKPSKNIAHIGFVASLLLVAAALFLQMGQVQLTLKSCFTSGQEQVYFGQKENCCAHVVDDNKPACCSKANALAASEKAQPNLMSQCCRVEQSSAVFLNFVPKEEGKSWFISLLSTERLRNFSWLVFEPFETRFEWVHQKIPPLSGAPLLIRLCRFLI